MTLNRNVPRLVVVLGLTLIAGAAWIYHFRRPRESAPAQIERLSEHHWSVPKGYKEAYFQDAGRINRDVHLKPLLSDNSSTLVSLTIEHLEENSPLYVAGFRKGDQIESLNGEPISTLGRALGLANEVRSASSIQVKVRREGKVWDFSCDFP